MNKTPRRAGAVVGLDVHPDTFAGAILRGRDPATAKVEHTSTRVPLAQLEAWALRHTQESDTLVLEASANSFAVAARLEGAGRTVLILDSHQAGKVGKVYCANDKVDAVKIARIHLSGLAAKVWQPDEKTLERREVFSAYQSVVKEGDAAQAADPGDAQRALCAPAGGLPAGASCLRPRACSSSRSGAPRKPCCSSRGNARGAGGGAERGEPGCGATWLEEILAEEGAPAPGAAVRHWGGDLLWVGLGHWRHCALCQQQEAGGLPGAQPERVSERRIRRRRPAQAARARADPGAVGAIGQEAAPGGQPVAEVGSGGGGTARTQQGGGGGVPPRRNEAAVAVARKLAAAVWHVLMGHVIGALEPIERLRAKLFKLATEIGVPAIKAMGHESKEAFIEKKLYLLKSYP